MFDQGRRGDPTGVRGPHLFVGTRGGGLGSSLGALVVSYPQLPSPNLARDVTAPHCLLPRYRWRLMGAGWSASDAATSRQVRSRLVNSALMGTVAGQSATHSLPPWTLPTGNSEGARSSLSSRIQWLVLLRGIPPLYSLPLLVSLVQARCPWSRGRLGGASGGCGGWCGQRGGDEHAGARLAGLAETLVPGRLPE